ncbi:MAG: hypothetical protein FOGNACKC_03439 [Anaerolineae bacterium]|nr:hypothetical protein [Anaerolineae bacterium]
MPDLNVSQEQLNEVFQRLRQRWLNSGDAWNDKVRREFENNYWRTIEAETQATLKEMGKLAHIINQARRNVR